MNSRGPEEVSRHKGCCTPARDAHVAGAEAPAPALSLDVRASPASACHEEAVIPSGGFAMGDAHGEGYPADGETPVHRVALAGFSIDTTAVTNRMFARFVRETGYRTLSAQ